MSSNVVNLEQYRSETQRTDEEAAAQPAELSTMSYAAVCDWAGADFERLIAAARARDYYPTWIQHQISNHGFEPRPAEAAVLARMIAEVGPYIPKRERQVLRQVKAKPTCIEVLARLAKGTPEYKGYKRLEICVARDVSKLVERALIQSRDGVISAANGSGEAPAKPRLMGAT